MKKTIALMLSVLMLAVFMAACSSSGSQTTIEATVVSDAPSEEASDVASEEPSESASEEASEAPSEEASEASEEASAEASSTGDGEVLTKVKSDGTLIMLTNASFPPYEYLGSDQKPVGVDVDIAQAIADKIGVQLEVVDMDFDGLIPALISGKGNVVLAGMTVTPEREESVDFSMPYADATQVIIVPKENATVASEDDLPGKIVGVQLGTTGDLLVSDLEGTTISQYKTGMEAALDLKNGRLDAIVLDQLPAESIVAQNEDLVTIPMESTNEQYAVAIPKGNEDLVILINSVIEDLQSSGAIADSTSKHIDAVKS